MKQQADIVEGLTTETTSRLPGQLSSRLQPENRALPLTVAGNTQVLTFDGRQNRIVFGSVTPKSGNNLATQLADLCAQLKAICTQHGIQPGDVARQCVFLKHENSRECCRAALKEVFGDVLPATSFIRQPPADGQEVALEILAFNGSGVRVRPINEHLTLVSDPDCRWAYIGGIEPLPNNRATYGQALSCFVQLQEYLQSAGFHFNQVVRTWIYERDIVANEESASGVKRQRYQIMNDARRDFFSTGNKGAPFSFSHDLPPASTGIGMCEGSFVMECLALDVPSGAIEIKPLNNPEQIDAHAYTHEVLERGAAAIKAAPLFSRGMSVRKDYVMLLISGTASIKGQQTVCLDDAAGQTRTTLENIALVVRQAKATLQDVQQARIYIKNSASHEELTRRIRIIKDVVESTLPGIPKLYLIADVCRDNLLVEIEALSFVRAHKVAPPNLKLLTETQPCACHQPENADCRCHLDR